MRQGFSLVELSIVLVILGLLTGGILAGQSLIRAAELRSVSTEFTRYKTAAAAFRDKYMALPGDITNATSFWGGVCGANCSCSGLGQLETPATLTCNGNGNSWVDYSNEQWSFWQQLSNAGLIEGSFSGRQPSGGWSKVNISNPASRVGNGAYWGIFAGGSDVALIQPPTTAGTHWVFAGNYGNSLHLSRSSGGTPVLGVLRPSDAWNIDMKLDDGKPGRGMMVVVKQGNGTYCTTTDVTPPPGDANSEYNLTITADGCSPIFREAM